MAIVNAVVVCIHGVQFQLIVAGFELVGWVAAAPVSDEGDSLDAGGLGPGVCSPSFIVCHVPLLATADAKQDVSSGAGGGVPLPRGGVVGGVVAAVMAVVRVVHG